LKSESFVSVVMVVDRYDSGLPEVVSQIRDTIDAEYSDYEILLIAQGPFVDLKSGTQIESMISQLSSVRYIQLSTRVRSDVAWSAGLENAIGDFVVLFNHRVDPVSVISGLVQTCRSGSDVVVGVSKSPQSYMRKVFRKCAQSLLCAIDYKLPPNATGLRCLSRRAVNAVMSTGRFHHQLYMRIQKTAYPMCIFEYDVLDETVGKKSFADDITKLVFLLVFNSSKPLRWMSVLGVIGSCVAFLFAAYSVLIHLISGNVVQGWTTTILFMSMLFMLQFVMLAFFGEYMGRLLDDRSEQDDYSVVFEKNSKVMVNRDRINVLEDSLSPDDNLVQTGRNR